MPNLEVFRPLSLGETLCKTIAIFFSGLNVFLPLSFAATLPVCLTTLLFFSSLPDEDKNADIVDYLALLLRSFMIFLLFLAMLNVIISFTVEAAMIRVAAESLVGRSPRWYSCLRNGFNFFGNLLCARLLVWFFLLSTLALVGGLSVALIYAHMNPAYSIVTVLAICYLGVSFTVWTTSMILYPIIVVENKRPAEAIRRAFVLSRGLRCYFFCCFLCLWITKIFVLVVLQNIFVKASEVSGLFSVMGFIIGASGSLLSFPLSTVLSTVMYFSARSYQENFSPTEFLTDLHLLESGDEEAVALSDVGPDHQPNESPPVV